jgi:chaperonin cofactor prefoldin
MELGMIRETKEKTNKELQALKARYKNAQERLNNFNSHLPKGFSEALEALSKEIEAKKEELEYKTTDIEIEEEADLMIRSIGDGIAKLDRDTILGIDWLQKYVESITIEFKHTRRGRKEFSTPIVAKYNLLQSKVRSVLRTVRPLRLQFLIRGYRSIKYSVVVLVLIAAQ